MLTFNDEEFHVLLNFSMFYSTIPCFTELLVAGETAVGKEDATLIRVALCRILGALYCIG